MVRDISNDGVTELTRAEHEAKGPLESKRVQVIGYIPGTDTPVRISAVDNLDGTYSLKTTSVGGGGGGGDASAANQVTGNASLSSIDTKLSSQATGSKQDTGNTSIGSVDTKTPALGQALAAGSTPVVLTAAQVTTLTPPAAITNYANETGGNLATIAGKDFATQTTLALVKAKTDNLDVALSTRTKPSDQQHVIVDSSASIAVTGPLTDTQLRATPVPVSGTVTATPSGTQDDNIKQVNGATVNVGIGTAGTGTQRVAVSSDSFPASQAVTGTFFQGTQPVSLATNTPTLQSGSTTAVTQPTAANLNATVVGTGTFVTQSTLAAETTKVIGTVNQGTSPWITSNATTSVVGNGAAATAQRVTLANDSTGIIATVGAVTAITNALPAGTNNIGDVDVLTLPVAFNAGNASATTQRVVIATDQATVAVNDNGGSLTVDGTFFQATQPVSIAATVATQAIRSTTNTTATVASSATVVTLAASNANRLGATIYNDSSALLYVKLGASASTSDFTAVIAPLTSSIGGYYEIPFGFTGIITGIWASATGNARVGELT